MSWSTEIHIGELRPWPDSVRVIRGTTDETRRYVPEEDCVELRELARAMPYCMEGKCLECPLVSEFDTSIGGVPECRAIFKLRKLGIEVD